VEKDLIGAPFRQEPKNKATTTLSYWGSPPMILETNDKTGVLKKNLRRTNQNGGGKGKDVAHKQYNYLWKRGGREKRKHVGKGQEKGKEALSERKNATGPTR